ncbi:MAG: Lrp/AsnC family transcriptional regulator, regulator for asnA, asnC and gidA [Archaeoglobaceae archaeon]|nr:Lrp/AsnC family transcriptional regulator, regulator for asnA, asnC and gidA [Archaeoglobaceae archaeon]MDK2876463.1 Lrp/AsnC family transcriptional regulator, regulator for asnA, asnC and gidA [Archaeoglobaceae archaeon]
MDKKDIKLISILTEDARKTLQELADELGLSVSSIHKRIRKLEKEVIERYTVMLNPEKFNQITAFLLLSARDPKRIAEELKGIPQIIELYQTFGNFNFILKTRGGSIEEISEITNKISSIDGVEMVECIVATKRLKEAPWKPEVRL